MNKQKYFPFAIVALALPLIILFQNCDGLNLEDSSSSNSRGAPDDFFVDPAAGEAYFANTLEPLMRNQCSSCHAIPRDGGTAPTILFNYDSMKSNILNGPSTTNNTMFNYTSGTEGNHPNQCFSGLNDTPCKEIIQWKLLEDPDTAVGGAGLVSQVFLTGRVVGWSVDSENENKKVNVMVFIDGPAGVGTPIGPFLADQQGAGGTYGGHYFDFNLPPQFADGQSHTLYAYGDEAVEENIFAQMPLEFTAFTPKQAGRNFYNSNLAGTITASCSRCHGWTYDSAYSRLLSPAPFLGGSAANNNFLIQASGGNGHRGGNFCSGGINSGLCADIQSWWQLEVD